MAALCPGVQYGLSSQQNFGENKDLIFVKLTDSALRAIEDYIKNQNKFSCPSPTIKFIGNENGELSLPRGSGEQRPTSFSFSVGSTADIVGPSGSFECLRQAGPPGGPLEGLGAVPHKMWVLANEDVYEATRHRMTEAEDKYKNKCTREIKPNQTDIGRKVKVKQSARPAIPPPPPRQREPPSAPQPSMRDSLMKSTGAPPPKPPAPPPPHPSPNGMSNGLGSNHVSSSRQPPQQQQQQQQQQKRPSVPDVARRPLRERLIHLLALRPFKKVELHDRLMKEGVREKKSMMSVLNAISHSKDNCFHLNSSMWEEVNEDWPFYTETERQILRRRKPQNRSSPGGGSDGGSSTGSGQSPTSTHPGSPPPPVKRPPPPAPAAAHNGAGPPPSDGGPPYKRPRIAHGHHRPADPPYRQVPENNATQRRPPTDLRDASNMNPRSRETPSPINGHHQVVPGSLPPRCSPDDNDPSPDRRRPASGGRVTSSTTPRVVPVRVSPDSQTEGLPDGATVDTPNGRDGKWEEAEEEDEFPDYNKLYVPISNLEQRRRYKSDFNADYTEYKYLHGIVEKVSRHFAQLEERLKQQDKNSPTYKDIRKQIVREYHEIKTDARQQRAKRRFHYLHDKLSHIKGLVADYDKAGTCGAY